jgi:hypothetical protein
MDNEIKSVNYLEKLKQYQKQYYKDNKEKMKIAGNLHYKNNKEHCLERMKQYREVKKDELNEKKLEKIQCDCGALISRSNMATHKKSNKHIKALPN